MVSALDDTLPYDGPLRRRGRQIRRLATVATQPRMYPRAPVAKAFWFDGMANFGDGLTPWLLARLGVIPTHAAASTADLAGVGSILEMLPSDFRGAVWGSGSLGGGRVHLPQARLLAVRGELTRELIGGAAHVALGDPGILVSQLMRRPTRRWRIGIVPHHFHEDDPLWGEIVASKRPGEVKIINVRRGPTAVLREIGACEVIVTTSLHGLISADAFGVPAFWTVREPHLWGGDFKFRDYESALTPNGSREVGLDSSESLESALRRARTVDANLLKMRQGALVRALQQAGLPRSSPVFAVRHLLGSPKKPGLGAPSSKNGA